MSLTVPSLRGAKRRGSLLKLVSARHLGRGSPWFEHRAVCEVDCFAALAKTGWGSQRRDGVRNDGVVLAMTGWCSQ